MDLDERQQHSTIEDEDDMPELQSVSNSSDSELSESDYEERRQVVEAVEDDDGDSNWSDVDDEQAMPPLEPTSGNRRPRADDDQDEGRDRRPPSERVNAPAPTPTPAAQPQPQPQPQPNFNIQPIFTQFLEMLQNLAANPNMMFGAPPPQPKDSQENALRIISGLEVVPEGLIRRLERVSALTTPAVDDAAAVGGDSGCAICWDRLLDGEGAEFASSESSTNTSEAAPAKAELPQGIIALPCAHLYHASCLVPWFSRAGQTTCPTCRFDLDPSGVIWYGGHKREPGGGGPMPFFFPPNGEAPGAFEPDEMDPDEMGGFGWGGGDEDPLWDFGGPPDDDEQDEDEDMPPLEPIPGRAAPQLDDDMPALEPIAGSNATPTTSVNNPPIPAPTNPNPQPQPQRAPPDNNNPFAQLRNAFRGVFSNNNINLGLNTGAPNNNTTPPQLSQILRNLVPGAGARRRDANDTNVPPTTVPAPSANAAPPPPPMFRFGAPQGGAAPPNQQAPPNPPPFTFHGPGAQPPGGGFTMQPDQATAFLRAIGLGDILQNMNMNGAQANGRTPEDFHVHVGMGGMTMPDWARDMGPTFAIPVHVRLDQQQQQQQQQPRPQNNDTNNPEPVLEWSPPDSPGPTVRERVERRERDAGLRCWDSSCGVGPSDDDPFIEVPQSSHQISIVGADEKNVCPHTFHPMCLVSAQRSRRGWLEPHVVEEEESGQSVQVACSVCRADGTVSQAQWLEGLAS
ncbi:RING-type domain-containing protein [Mycena indigotica]|uniref:RING-type domain-containing protein n=1 Tax=Mycena indigotica TaxID=2126181 RepID=A0A8H6SSV5_9AGAR|nr:RING-type domain-containing protein [Mycena indigotica]KAF7303762.1 RING-type domain-containing protein [Mycena indigotica]